MKVLKKIIKLNNDYTSIIILIVLVVLSVLILALVYPALAQEVPNPIKASPAGSPKATIIDLAFAGLAGFSAVFAILAMGFILVNSFKLIVSGGNEESITAAKSGITWSVAAFIVAIFAFSLIAATHKIFGGVDTKELENPDVLTLPIGDAGFVDAFATFFRNLTAIASIAAALFIVYAGIKMVMSRGNGEAVTSAKTILKWAVVGLIVMVLAFAILQGLDSLLVR